MSLINTDACYVCDQPVTYNALLVPCFYKDGKKHPLCPRCVEFANPRRVARGLSAIKIWPGTYGPFEQDDIFRFTGIVE